MDKLRNVDHIKEWVPIQSDGGQRSGFGQVLDVEVFDEF